MDPITMAILAALATTASQAVVGRMATDAYENIVDTLRRRFGDNSEVVRAVENLEKNPESAGRKQTLEEEVQSSGADQDPEVRKAAEELLDQLRTQPGGEQHIQNAVGNYIAQADRSSTAEVRINRSEE